MEVLKEAIDAGKIKNVCETFTDGWKPDNAQKNMEQCLTANDNKVDAVVSENDGMAGGVVAALEAQGLAGTVPVSGQDGDKAALNRVALGTQTRVGLEGLARARQERRPKSPSRSPTARRWTPSRRRQVHRRPEGRRDERRPASPPNPITKDNLNDVIDAGWITKEEVCAGVAAGSVAGLQLIRLPD